MSARRQNQTVIRKLAPVIECHVTGFSVNANDMTPIEKLDIVLPILIGLSQSEARIVLLAEKQTLR